MFERAKWFLVLGLAAISSLAATARVSAPGPVPSVAAKEDLGAILDELRIPFSRLEGSGYRALLTDANRSMNFFFFVEDAWTEQNENVVRAVKMFAPISVIDHAGRPSPALLDKLRVINTNLQMGKVIYEEGQPGGAFYVSTFWLNDSNADIVWNHLYYAWHNYEDLVEILVPFLSD